MKKPPSWRVGVFSKEELALFQMGSSVAMRSSLLVMAANLLHATQLPELFCVGSGCRAAPREARQLGPTAEASGGAAAREVEPLMRSDADERLSAGTRLLNDGSQLLPIAQRELFEFRGQRSLCADGDAVHTRATACSQHRRERVLTVLGTGVAGDGCCSAQAIRRHCTSTHTQE